MRKKGEIIMQKTYSRKDLLKDGMRSIRSNIKLMKRYCELGDFDESVAFYKIAHAKASMFRDLCLISNDKLYLLESIIDNNFCRY